MPNPCALCTRPAWCARYDECHRARHVLHPAPAAEDLAIALDVLRHARENHRRYAECWKYFGAAAREVAARRALGEALRRVVMWMEGVADA